LKTYRNLIWITLLGIAVVFLARPIPPNKSSIGGTDACGFVKPSPKVSDTVDSTPPLSPVPPTIEKQTVDQPIVKAESASPPETDPEKIAVLISSLSEAEVCERLGNFTNQDLNGNTGRLLIRRWVELNPTAAVNWVTQLADSDVRSELVDVVAVAWSEKDLLNALTWVESLPEDTTKHQALTDLGYEVARVDPVSAMQIATQLPTGDNGDNLLLHSLAQYASADPAQSQQLALALPQGSLRDQALSTVATVEAKQDGEGAARFVAENISPGPRLDSAIIGVVQLWGQTSLADASAWVQSFPDLPIRYQAVQSLNMMDAH
jgi:hypothetical protein